MLVEVSCMCNWNRSTVFFIFHLFHTMYDIVNVNLLQNFPCLKKLYVILFCKLSNVAVNSCLFSLPRNSSVRDAMNLIKKIKNYKKL